MDRHKRPFALYRRKLTKGVPVYYAKFRDPASGWYTTTRATGKTSRIRAEEWAWEYLADQANRPANLPASTNSTATLGDLADGFWSWTAHYAESRRARGYSISRGHLDISEGYTRNHIIPVWGPVKISDIAPGEIDRWILSLHRSKHIAPSTINKILQTLRSLLDAAVSQGYLKENPAASVKPVRSDCKRRGVLTDDEVRILLRWPGPFQDFRQYAINLLAFSTGARIGEIRGLLTENVYSDRIEIKTSWEEQYGLKEPKYGSIRAVPISPLVADTLDRIKRETEPESLFFCGAVTKSRPVSKSWIENGLRNALVALALPDKNDRTDTEKRAKALEGIKQRNITFHSWRHKLNTVLRANGIPDSKIRLLTGHRSQEMTAWYTAYTSTDYSDVRNVQSALLEAAS